MNGTSEQRHRLLVVGFLIMTVPVGVVQVKRLSPAAEVNGNARIAGEIRRLHSQSRLLVKWRFFTNYRGGDGDASV